MQQGEAGNVGWMSGLSVMTLASPADRPLISTCTHKVRPGVRSIAQPAKSTEPSASRVAVSKPPSGGLATAKTDKSTSGRATTYRTWFS